MKYSIPKLYGSDIILFGIITLSIVIVTIDLEISNTAVFGHQFLTSNSGFLTYCTIVLAFWISQTMFYYSTRTRLKVMRFKGKRLVFTSRLLETSLWLLLILNFFTIVEMLSFGHYSIYLLILVIIISYSLNILFMSLLSFMLISWSKVSKNKVPDIVQPGIYFQLLYLG